jgi:hypothetical protein
MAMVERTEEKNQKQLKDTVEIRESEDQRSVRDAILEGKSNWA